MSLGPDHLAHFLIYDLKELIIEELMLIKIFLALEPLDQLFYRFNRRPVIDY